MRKILFLHRKPGAMIIAYDGWTFGPGDATDVWELLRLKCGVMLPDLRTIYGRRVGPDETVEVFNVVERKKCSATI